MNSVATQDPPGGLTWSRFKAISADVGSWTWGTVQGAFNEKASFSQILVDAVIGMIPLVGDVTAVRDIIAVVIRLIDDPNARDDVWEWVLLVVLVVALIPVIGGVVKGVGRILVKVFKAAENLKGAARARMIAEGAQEIIAFLNRIGWKNAEKWFLNLRFADYQRQIMERFSALVNTLHAALGRIKAKAGSAIPSSLIQRIDALREGMRQLETKGSEMIPLAVRELDQSLREMQAFVRSGGETTSRQTLHQVAAGEKIVTRADEARLVEGGPLPARSVRGGWKQNDALVKDEKTWKKYYEPAPGYPDLTKYPRDGHFTDIVAFSGQIFNRPLRPGESIFRLFGPGGTTHGIDVYPSNPVGAWWGVGDAPKSAKEWRLPCAVLDEFNRDGFLVKATVPNKADIKAVVGTVAEQGATRISGQYLPGGATQAVIHFDETVKAAIAAQAADVVALGKPAVWVDPRTGMKFEISPTGWNDTNGVWGYVRLPDQAAVQTARLTTREIASKENREVTVNP